MQEHILIVDDDSQIVNICQRFLSKKYTVDSAPTSEMAMRMCKDKSYDLMLLDLKLPDISGMEVLKWAKKNYTKCAVVIITGFGTPVTLKDIMSEGADGYLEKPFELSELDNVIKSALEKRSKNKDVLSGKKILLVEDEEDVSEFYSMLLKLKKADVITAHDGKSALKKIKQENPDMVLLDIMLFGVSGFEICRKIRRDDKFKKIPIIILTARADEKDKIKGIEAGANAYLEKTINPDVLIGELEKHLT